MLKMMLAVPAVIAAGVSVAHADDESALTAVVFPRANYMAVKGAYVEPFINQSGISTKVVTYDGQVNELAAMVKEGKPIWDVIQVESRTLDVGCREGLLEKLDAGRIGKKGDFVRGSVSECGIGIFAWSQALAYDADKVAGMPASWADFWDTKKFPGKRGLRRSAKYTLEFALLADGVAPADVYKVLSTKQGVDRAFRKLDEIKADVVWWEAAPQPALYLAAARVVMTSAYTLWIDADQKLGKNFKVVWKGSLYDFDSWAIPKGTPHLADAYKFIAFASSPENQKAFSGELAYGPTNVKTLPMLEPKLAAALPTAIANFKDAVQISTSFWIKNAAELEKRFDLWAPRIYKQESDEEHEENPNAPPSEHRHF